MTTAAEPTTPDTEPNAEPAFLTPDAILTADDLIYEDVHVPEWGGKVRLRALSSAERDEFEASLFQEVPDPKKPGKTVMKVVRQNGRARLVALCMIHAVGDRAGERMFPDDRQVVQLGKKNGAALNRCFEAASRLSGLSKEATDELGKDSAGTRSDSPSSGSLES
jgi:hypothetical protein